MRTIPMKSRLTHRIPYLALVLSLLSAVPSREALANSPAHPSATATLSRRAAKPGECVELVLTVRRASSPLVESPLKFEGFRVRRLHPPRMIRVNGEDVRLYRYSLTPLAVGEYELRPIRISDGARIFVTKPLFLHVSTKGDPAPLSPKELALGVDIPLALGEEVLQNTPQPTPSPEATPKPSHTRPWTAKTLSLLRKGAEFLWNYPGK